MRDAVSHWLGANLESSLLKSVESMSNCILTDLKLHVHVLKSPDIENGLTLPAQGMEYSK